ncbi:MAG: hypothetical protein RIM72_00055 [Alphaproteobacteria bacterium]
MIEMPAEDNPCIDKYRDTSASVRPTQNRSEKSFFPVPVKDLHLLPPRAAVNSFIKERRRYPQAVMAANWIIAGGLL